jgi:hypothetical protein
MNSSLIPSLLDVAISLVLVFFILSMFVSGLVEFINGVLNNRSVLLKNSIEKLLKSGLTQQLYDHPLIKEMRFKPNKLPSYISANVFARSVIDMLLRAAGTNEQAAEATIENLRKGAKAIEVDEVRVMVESLLHEVEKFDQFRLNLETWFNDYMDRVSGWFKSMTNRYAWALAVVVAIGFNVDTIYLTKALYSDKPLREKVVQQAINTVANPNTMMKTDSTKTGIAVVEKQAEQLNELKNQLTELQLPIGWNVHQGQDFWGWCLKLIGWAITAAALSFGAPFWFDLLVKLVNIRNTGNKPK